MKKVLKIFPLIVLTITLTTSCSEHCDDEDYRLKEQEKANKAALIAAKEKKI
ncbi:hypothetical protein [Flavobacterium foetidum]|uniref:hypothetical protein n=1 Tax=Flavobacterium foetidum TaxID=2026681 RepID=UPI0013C2AD3A|nr:hypothetical protein [Flavobacterium foetidum]KAF2517175.1 hypothetical protein E0W73_03505 [Flavobacterium foetidum]